MVVSAGWFAEAGKVPTQELWLVALSTGGLAEPEAPKVPTEVLRLAESAKVLLTESPEKPANGSARGLEPGLDSGLVLPTVSAGRIAKAEGP